MHIKQFDLQGKNHSTKTIKIWFTKEKVEILNN